jgi:hypothetical protein
MIASLVLFAALASGAEIPAWRAVTLYPRDALERLDSRFDLSPVRDGPRVTILADRAEGTFDVLVEVGTRRVTLAVRSIAAGDNPLERVLVAGEGGACLRLRLAGGGSVPLEASVEGLASELDGNYAAMARATESTLRVYESAEQELVEEYLPGSWDVDGQPVEASAAGSRPPVVRLGASEFWVSIPRAPSGTDVILLPRDGSLPSAAIRLRGFDRFVEVPLRCRTATKIGFACEVSGAGRAFRRAGSRLNR